ncbi:hypothetical protein ACPA9J_02055 [Pseudomonas aeruginosa]
MAPPPARDGRLPWRRGAAQLIEVLGQLAGHPQGRDGLVLESPTTLIATGGPPVRVLYLRRLSAGTALRAGHGAAPGGLARRVDGPSAWTRHQPWRLMRNILARGWRSACWAIFGAASFLPDDAVSDACGAWKYVPSPACWKSCSSAARRRRGQALATCGVELQRRCAATGERAADPQEIQAILRDLLLAASALPQVR